MPLRDVIRQHGHRRIVELLARTVSRGTLPPSLIFAGPPGAGKRATALALAQTLNCLRNPQSGDARDGREDRTGNEHLNEDLNEDLKEDLKKDLKKDLKEDLKKDLKNDACGECPACTRIARAVHPDVFVVTPGETGAIKVDQVRDVVDRAAYRPFEGRRRVIVIDQADALVPAAQNALLKTLEEPPPSSVFILVTSRPDALLATVRSRCIRLTFAEAGRYEVDADVRDVAQRVLVRAASGSDATRLEGAQALLTGTGTGGAADRAQVASHLHAMASLLRDIQAIANHASDSLLVNADVKPSLEELVPAYRGERGVSAFAAIGRALAAIERNAGVKVVADWLVLQL